MGPWIWGRIKRSDHRAFALCRRFRDQEIQRRVSRAEVALSKTRRRSSIVRAVEEVSAKIEKQVCTKCACVWGGGVDVPDR